MSNFISKIIERRKKKIEKVDKGKTNMGLCSLGMGNRCKHNIENRREKCFFCELESRITNEKEHLRGGQDALEERIKNLENLFLSSPLKMDIHRDRKPYKCPVCAGFGILRNPNLTMNKQIINVDCVPCAGKGIVWGQ